MPKFHLTQKETSQIWELYADEVRDTPKDTGDVRFVLSEYDIINLLSSYREIEDRHSAYSLVHLAVEDKVPKYAQNGSHEYNIWAILSGKRRVF